MKSGGVACSCRPQQLNSCPPEASAGADGSCGCGRLALRVAYGQRGRLATPTLVAARVTCATMMGPVLDFLRSLTPTNWIAIAAMVISLVSLTFSSLSYFRDRPRLKITARWYRSDETPGYIEVKAVNVGRRPIYLTTLWGYIRSGGGSGSSFDYGGNGIKLGEHEFKVFRITHLRRGKDEFDASGCFDEDQYDFDRMAIEDSTGKSHKMKQVDRCLAPLLADYREWCARTGYWRTPAPQPQVPQTETVAPTALTTSSEG